MHESTLTTLRRILSHPEPMQLAYQLQEIVEDGSYLQHGVTVEEGDVVLDVGANVGVSAALFALECGAGVVHSFEPIPAIFEQLERNVGHLEACVLHNYGLSSESGSRTITYYPHNSALSSAYADPVADSKMIETVRLNLGRTAEEAAEGLADQFARVELNCEFRTVSEVLRAEGIDRVNLLKIDVEKAELDVLEGIDEADWPSIRQVALEVHLDEEQRHRAQQLLRARGFDVGVTQNPTMRGTQVHMVYAVRG